MKIMKSILMVQMVNLGGSLFAETLDVYPADPPSRDAGLFSNWLNWHNKESNVKSRPNVLLFLTDDQRFDTIGALGNDQIKTPYLDKLVQQGVTFTKAYIPGGTSPAVCMPSRAMLNTGRNLFHIQREGQEISEDRMTMGECFRRAGYETFGTGKWHNGRSAYARSFSAGDNIFFGGMADHWNVPVYRFDPTGKYDKKCARIKDPARSNQVEFRGCDHIEVGVHSTDLIIDSSLHFLKERDTSTPFFMYVALLAPHDPRTMPDKFREMYDPAAMKLPPNFMLEYPLFDAETLELRDEQLASYPRDPDEIRRHIAEYYGMISHLDDALGRLLAALEKSGELDNTLIVVAGDNGLALGRHGLMGKQSLYEHSLRVPLIFVGPGIPERHRSESLVYLLDIFPTLCELAGIEMPAEMDGKSLCACLKDPSANVRDKLYLAYRNTIRGISDGEQKLIEYASGQTQLFDLKQDPFELENLAELDSSVPLIIEMRRDLVRMAEEEADWVHPMGKEFWRERPDISADLKNHSRP